jgi:flagellar motor switch protein FliG
MSRTKMVSGPQKAAMLLVSLGMERSAKVVKHLKESEVEALMTEVASLRKPDPESMGEVLNEFHQMAADRVIALHGGLEVARDLLERSLGPAKAAEILSRVEAAMTDVPFENLRRADPRQVLSVLQDEHPQTIALVLAHMSSEQAALVLSGLAHELQGEVARRIGVMESTSPEVIKHVEAVLERKASTLLQSSDMTAAGGILPLVDILNRADRATEKTILENLERDDPELADEVRNRMFVFEDITKLEDRAVQLVLREIDSKTLALALKGVKPEVKDKIGRNMSERAASNLSEEIDLLGPTRLKDVEEAQGAIVRAIRTLADAGQIVLARGADEFVV